MTRPIDRTLAIVVRTLVAAGGVTFFVLAFLAVWNRPELREGAFTLQLLLLATASALSRRFGVALPGKGFASFNLAVVLIALLLRGWQLAVLAASLGTLTGDLLFRRVRPPDALNTLAHVNLGTGVAGLLYGSLGGGTGAAALAPENIALLGLAIVTLPLAVDATSYVGLTLSGMFPRADLRLTVRWQSVISAAGSALAIGWVSLVTSGLAPAPTTVLAAVLLGAGWLVYWVVRTAIHADELRLVQGLAGAVAGEVSIDRNFARIQQLTRHLVPWDNMGFARYDQPQHQMVLLADTAHDQGLRFDADTGLTGEAVRTRRAVVTNALTRSEQALPEGESPGSEVVVPLYHGDQLVGMWSVRHSDPTTYRDADAELLSLLGPQLALSLVLSSMISPMAESSERTAEHVRKLTTASDAIRGAADVVVKSATHAEAEANRAAGRVEQAGRVLGELVDSIGDTIHAATETQEASRATSATAAGVQQASGRAAAQLGQLLETIEEGTAEVERLRSAAQEVEQFSDTIGQIANQTNLLALNATIEAARTGVHGKGFAVVAEQVRNLAEQSGEAARNMGHSAHETRRVIDRAVRVLEELGSRLSEVAQASQQWGGELTRVVSTAEAAQSAGERMVHGPQQNMSLAEQVKQALADAQAAAASSASEAANVAAAAQDQRRVIEKLVQGAADLTELADQMARGARLVRADDTQGSS